MRRTFAIYGEDVTYVSVDLTEEEYNGVKKIMKELHDENGKPYDRNVDIKEHEE